MTAAVLPPPPDREDLRSHLVATRIAGDVATPRQNNLEHYRLLSERQRHYLLGLCLDGDWTPSDVLTLMAKKAGVSPDETYRVGTDTIDPERTIAATEAMGDRLRLAVERRESLLLATGHPAGMLPVFVEVARALEARGCTVLEPASGWLYVTPSEYGRVERQIRYIDGVAALAAGGALHHTHSPRPMEEMLRRLVEAGRAMPGLVVADHGWAGAAGEAGLDVVGFADSNDPALFVGEAEGKLRAVVPLDDNVDPRAYAPLTAYLLRHAGL
ncbi:MAG: phosphatase [Streptosporangiaceae bacterium]